MQTTNQQQPIPSAKFIVNTCAMLRSLKTFPSVIDKGKKILTVLETIKFTLNNQLLSMQATDLVNTITTTMCIDAELSDTGTTYIYSFCVPKKIINLLALLGNQPITMTYYEETNTLVIESENEVFNLGTVNGKEFPSIAYESQELQTLAVFNNLDAISEFINELKYHRLFRGTDHLKENLTGTYLEIDENELKLTSTDANKLKTTTINGVTGKKYNAILNPSILNIIAKLKLEWLTIKGNEQFICFEYEDGIIAGRNITEKYPDYDAVIPKDHPNKITFSVADLKALLTKAKYFVTNEYGVVFAFTNNKLTLKVKNKDWFTSNLASVKNELIVTQTYQGSIVTDYVGEARYIKFNANFILTALNSIPKGIETVTLEIADISFRAGILKTDNSTILIMPMMINDYEEENG